MIKGVSLDDALVLGHSIVEMAERVRVLDKCAPGSWAGWEFKMDGVSYLVRVEVDPDA